MITSQHASRHLAWDTCPAWRHLNPDNERDPIKTLTYAYKLARVRLRERERER